MDRPAFTAGEVQSILQDDREEMDRLARSLGNDNEDDESIGGIPRVYTVNEDKEDSQDDEP